MPGRTPGQIARRALSKGLNPLSDVRCHKSGPTPPPWEIVPGSAPCCVRSQSPPGRAWLTRPPWIPPLESAVGRSRESPFWMPSGSAEVVFFRFHVRIPPGERALLRPKHLCLPLPSTPRFCGTPALGVRTVRSGHPRRVSPGSRGSGLRSSSSRGKRWGRRDRCWRRCSPGHEPGSGETPLCCVVGSGP